MIVGTVLQTASQNVRMFIGARWLIGFGLNFAATGAPMLISELAYPSKLTSHFPFHSAAYNNILSTRSARAADLPLQQPLVSSLSNNLVAILKSFENFTQDLWKFHSGVDCEYSIPPYNDNLKSVQTFGTFHIHTSWSWRIPSAIQGFPSVIQLIFIWFVPESPRWLVSKGR